MHIFLYLNVFILDNTHLGLFPPLFFPHPCNPAMATFHFPVSSVTPGYVLISEGMEVGASDDGEHMALAILTQYTSLNICVIHSGHPYHLFCFSGARDQTQSLSYTRETLSL